MVCVRGGSWESWSLVKGAAKQPAVHVPSPKPEFGSSRWVLTGTGDGGCDVIQQMAAFFKEAGEVKQIRWLTDKESGEFRGCGFVEFYDTDGVDKAILKNGEQLLGRNVRLDYSAPRAPREY